MKPHPEVVELDVDDLQSKLNQIEQRIGQEFAEPFRRLLGAYHMLQTLLRDKSISIQRLRKIIFGAASEKTSDVLESPGESLDSSTDDAANPSTTPPATSGDATSGTDALTLTNDPATSSNDSPAPSGDGDRSQRGRPGHGRIGADQYTGCAKVIITHDSLHPGDTCPQCGTGTVYRQSHWSPVVRLKGQPPVRGAEVGDLYMSLIHTCYLAKADPFDYLTQLQRHHDQVQAAPGDWMPWNYKQQLSATQADLESSGGASEQAHADSQSSGGATPQAHAVSEPSGSASPQAHAAPEQSADASEQAHADSESSGGGSQRAVAFRVPDG